jgi:hypothetical protein
MPSSSDFPAQGKVIRVEEGFVIFAPSNTNYELKLIALPRYDGPVDKVVEVFISATARKLWTVSSGGNFLTPIQGPTRIVQGRIKYLDEKVMVVQAGAPVVIELPILDTACDLNAGPLTVGSLVNATLVPGARLQLAAAAAAR